MARLVGPDDASRLAYGIRKDRLLYATQGLTATVYSDAAGTILADILTYPGGSAITGSKLTVSSDSLLPLFQYPDGVDTVYVSVNGGPVVAVYARTDDRLDAAVATMADLPAAQAARRAGMADRALLGSAGWIIKRRNVDEYRLMRDVGDGFVADHQLVRDVCSVTPGPTAGPGGELRALLLNDMGVGIPMIPVPFADATNNTTYTGTGWSTVPAYFSGVRPPTTLGVDPAFPTVTTTAGSTTVTITSAALLPTLRYTSRNITIPGAGAGGVDLITTLAAVNANGLSFTAGTAPSTAVTGVTATIHPGRRATATTNDVASWTAPLGATSIGVVHGTGGNGGFSIVAIDGDKTRATHLPTAQQLVDKGIAPSSILATIDPSWRLLDLYSPVEQFSTWQALASGLDPSVPHTVTITVSGFRRAASISNRIIIGGWGYGTATTTATTPTAIPFISSRASKSSPVHELAIDHKPNGLSQSVFVGGHNHGYEFQTTGLTLTVDGAAVTMTDDQALPVMGTARLVRTSNLYHSQNTATPTLKARTSYVLSRSGLTVNTMIEAVVQTLVNSAYFNSFTAPHWLSRVQVDKDATVYNLGDYVTYPEGVDAGTGRNTGVVWWEPGGDLVAALIVPTAKESTGNWSDTTSGGLLATVRNFPTTSQSSKWYARRIGTMTVGTKWTGEATFIIGRLPDGATNYFPVV